MNRIIDVANAASVSVSTVSKVFNGYSDVADATRDKILQIARKLNYFPNHFASQLVRGKEESLCVILSMFGHSASKDEYLVGILSGIHSEAEKQGLRVIISTGDGIIGNNKNYVQYFHSNKFMGFIIHGLKANDPEIDHLLDNEIPCVFIDINISGKKTVSVTTDNVRSCAEVVDILAGLGHQHIVFVAGSEMAAVTMERIKGYKAGMKKNGLVPVVVQADFTYEFTYKKVKERMLQAPETTALFCASDVMASAAMAACADLGYRMPDDVSIVGYDDLSFASYLRPKLSSVAQNFFAIGAESTATLINMHQGKEVKPVNYIPYEIRIRQSVAKNTRN
ncbi:LacI family transcriptional regulator [Spirochaetia bacterium]|nr:LacI family transcriptional regulator [Spirochaetia bacterium]